MKWDILYHPLVKVDLKKFDQSNLILIFKAIDKVAINPQPHCKGGFGLPLGNHKYCLAGYFKIRLLKAGIRIIYSIDEEKQIMKILAVGFKSKNSVYNTAGKRLEKENILKQ
jgi:mRNA interferase RelE/StbE